LNYSKVKDFSEKERFSIIHISKGEIMYLPKTYEDFSDKFPEILKDYQQLGKSCR